MDDAPEVCLGHSVITCVGSGVWGGGDANEEEGGVSVMTKKLT